MSNKDVNRHALETFLIRIPVIILSFCYTIFLIRLLGPEGNGLFTYISASIGLSAIVINMDFTKSTGYHLANDQFNSSKVLGFSLVIYALSTVFIAIVLLTLYFTSVPAKQFFIPDPYFNLFYVLFFICSFSLLTLSEVIKIVLISLKKFKENNKVLLFSNVFQTCTYGIGFLVVSLAKNHVSLMSSFVLILLTQLVVTVIGIRYFKKHVKLTIDFQMGSIRKPFLRYTKLNYVNQIGHYLNKRMDVWFVEIYTGIASLGNYALASQFTNFLLLGVSPVEEVLKPYLVNMDRKEGNFMFIRFFKVVFYLICAASLMLFLLSPLLVPMVFGSAFLAAIVPLKILCLGIVFVTIKRLFMNYYRAYNELHYNNYAQWIGVFITLFLDLLLIPKYGIQGAAWASVFAYGTSAIIVGSIFLYKQRIPFLRLFIPDKEEVKHLYAFLKNYVKP